MVDDIEARLAAAAEALREFEVTSLHAADLHGRMAVLAGQIQSLRATHREAARLGWMSPTGLRAVLRGDRRDRLAAERAAADYRLRVAGAYLAAVRREQESVAGRLAHLAGAPATYAVVLAERERERELLESGGPRERLLVLDGELGQLAGELPALVEASRAASAAHDALRQVSGRLDRVDRWWLVLADTYVDPVMGAVAEPRLAAVAAAAAYADRCLAGLRNQLAGVGGVVPPAVWQWVERTARFFDPWLDQALATRPYRQRVARLRQQVDWSIRIVHDVHSPLEQRTATVRTRLGQLEAERRILLAG